MLVKVCGMREPENIRAAEKCDIDLMGFIFAPRSPRSSPLFTVRDSGPRAFVRP